MNPIPISSVLTHENPDLDAILSVLIIKRFGETLFPGVTNANILFSPAGQLPGGKTATELEQNGILAVDIGGGRFDTHPVNNEMDAKKLKRCAADLVAEAVGILHNENWETLVEYVRLQDTEARSINSRDYLHHLGSLPTIFSGVQLRFKHDSARILTEGVQLLELIPIYLENKSKIEKNILIETREILLATTNNFLLSHGIHSSNSHRENKHILENWYDRLNEDLNLAFSPDPLDEIVSIPALLLGLWIKENGDKEKCIDKLTIWLGFIYQREELWESAIKEFDNAAFIQKIRHANIIRIVSENGLVIKAARYRVHADLILFRDPTSGATSFLLNRKGPLAKYSMKNLAAKVRLAECIEENIQPEYSRLYSSGSLHKWFLHQSENLLICGSLKANEFTPSKIDITDLFEIAVSEVDWDKKIPQKYCPDAICLEEICPYYFLHFQTCKNHVKRINNSNTGNNLGYKLKQALEASKNKKQ